MVSVSIKEDNSGVKKLENLLKNLKPQYLKMGWFPSAHYDDKDSTPVAFIAAQNEYGNPNKFIPARPFMRPAIANNQKKWAEIGKRGYTAVLAGKSTGIQVLENIGVTGIGDIQHSIAQVYSPSLSPRTVKARLERHTYKGPLNKTQARTITKPLIDTGHMQATVAYEISSSP